MTVRRLVGATVLVGFIILGTRTGGHFQFEPVQPLDSHVVGFALPKRDAASRARSAGRSVPPSYRQDPLKYLSTAPLDSLQLLPGIGPVLAERLASARSGKSLFTRWEDLLGVKGIGPKKLQKLKDLADE